MIRNIIRLLSVFVLDHCVDSYYVLGVYTEWAVLISAPNLLRARATALFPSDDDVDDHVNQ